MDYKEIDMETYPRKAHFSYFSSMAYPYVGATVQMDITDYLRKIKARKDPVFLSLLYDASHAANAVRELRYRIKEGKLIEYEWCRSSYTLMLDNGTYCYCALDARKPRAEFLAYGAAEQEKAKERAIFADSEDSGDLFFVSCVPWLSYTGLTQPVPDPPDSNPRLTWGKFYEQGDKIMLPFTLLAHHALLDGKDIAAFYELLAQRFSRFEA